MLYKDCTFFKLKQLLSLKTAFKDVDNHKPMFTPPSIAVDKLWHAIIVETRLYASLCDSIASQFIHHQEVVLVEHLRVMRTNFKVTTKFIKWSDVVDHASDPEMEDVVCG